LEKITRVLNTRWLGLISDISRDGPRPASRYGKRDLQHKIDVAATKPGDRYQKTDTGPWAQVHGHANLIGSGQIAT